MRFAAWPFLLLLVLIPLLHRWWKKRNEPARVSFPLAIPKEIGLQSPVRTFLILRYLGWALMVVALARPQASFRTEQRQVSGIDILMVMDISASMNIEDLSDRSRFDVAKDVMSQFIQGRQNDRIGFVVFSGEPFTLAPPTLDYGLVMKSLREARIGVLRDGTAIGDGLALAVGHLRNSKAKSRVIILLTDGDSNVGQVDPGTAGELAAGYGIRVYTIAIGREGRVKLPIKHQGPFGQTVTTYQWYENALNPELLQLIAARSMGKFYRVTDETALTSVFKEIDQLERTEIRSNEKVRYEERYEKPLIFGLLLLLLEQLLTRFWWRFLP
ncbi:MAG: hypothetical protein A2X94_05345 [Bdellovibrionales bacterium GWB1_55_8]|nr:MAG: hypothetical protein A2X94_05345 [Bdellovibrionales bacterium GWB1_55_8]